MFSKTNSRPNLFHGSHLGFGKSQFLAGKKVIWNPDFLRLTPKIILDNFRSRDCVVLKVAKISQWPSNFFCTFPNFDNFNHKTSDNSRSSLTTRSVKICAINSVMPEPLISVMPKVLSICKRYVCRFYL